MWLILILLLLDLITKHFFVTVTNTGAAFGILKGFNIPLLVISLIALIICTFYYFKDKTLIIPLTFLIAGILGNSIYRILFGHVRDFINIGIFNFPVFNLADSYNVIGVILLIWILWKK